ncbi:unnamed protein product [Symbiodinium sp. CCMP2456]|nr:unnamed protein product [Symbiodinium sp. CCMP2456]
MPLRTLAAAAAVGLAALWARQGDTAREAASRRLPIAIDVGHAQSSVVLLFVHGWPDNAKEFQKQMSFFSELGYRCVAAELPMTEHGEKAPWGHDFDVLAQQLSNLAEFLRGHGGENRSLVLLGHDWGAWLTYMAQRQDPHLFDAIVPLDIAPGYGELPFSVKWRVVAYQQFALMCFLFGKLPLMQDAANKLLRHFMEQSLVSGYGEAGQLLTPTPLEEVTAAMGWPYWQTWKPPRFFLWARWQTHGLRGWKSNAADAQLAGELPSCPTLLLHGAASSKMDLTGRYFLEALRLKGGALRYSKAFDSHHWFFYWRAAEVNHEIHQFLQKLSLEP